MNETVPVKEMEPIRTVPVNRAGVPVLYVPVAPIFGRWRATIADDQFAAIFPVVEDKWELRFFGTSGQRDKFVAEANRRLDVKV